MIKFRARQLLKTELDEQRLLAARALQAFVGIAILLLLLAARFAWLQIFAHEQFAAKSDENRVRQKPIVPTRGLIFDRNGVLLAENRLAYRLELIPEQAGDVQKTYAELAKLVVLDEEANEDFAKSLRQYRKFEGVPVKLRLNDEELANLNVAMYRLPGVEIVPYFVRHYPSKALAAHVVGYVGRLDERDLERLAEAEDRTQMPVLRNYSGTTHIGKTGIESRYEDILHGTVGYERIEVNASGRTVRVLKRVPAVPGKNLYLSLDIRLQGEAFAAFGEQSGAAVAIDPSNGQVLAMVSKPSFDPNLYVNGISRKDYAALMQDPARPTFHRALSGTYPPGSTFKPFIGMAGLELGLRTAQDSVLSTGIFYLPGAKRGYRDWKAGGHGVVNLHEAMAQSVNTYFYKLALELGIDQLHDYVAQFGLGSVTGIDINGEATGLVPTKAWKAKVSKMPWFPGETVVCGIGQGQMSVTPVQLAVASATLASGGVRYPPHLLLATQEQLEKPIIPVPFPPINTTPFIRNPGNVETMRSAMVAVLHGPTGTARAVGNGLPFQIAGKTGTAQQISANAPRDAQGQVDPRYKNQALFVGFAPAEAPKLAVGLIVEQGGSGAHAAAPVGRAIFEAFLTPVAARARVNQAQAQVPPTQAADNEELPIDELEVPVTDVPVPEAPTSPASEPRANPLPEPTTESESQ